MGLQGTTPDLPTHPFVLLPITLVNLNCVNKPSLATLPKDFVHLFSLKVTYTIFIEQSKHEGFDIVNIFVTTMIYSCSIKLRLY